MDQTRARGSADQGDPLSIRNHFRPYDLIIRYGGDEFVCALSGMGIEDAAGRFSLVSADLNKQHASITVGLASLDPGVIAAVESLDRRKKS